jgi:DNA polymerase V
LSTYECSKNQANDSIPKMGAKISCGLFGISEDFIESYQSLDSLFIKNKFSTFFFEADGDSMEPTIFSGQILIVDRSIQNFIGRVAVVSFQNKLICKRIIRSKNSTDGLILYSDNHCRYPEIHVHNPDDLHYFGVVIAVAGFIK